MKQLQRLIVAFSLASAIAFGGAALVSAAPNPSGTGQPGAECGGPGAEQEPHGFTTEGFARAESVYAGSEGSASAAHAGSSHAVSQYDIACYQVTSNGK
jgi:hypothetical protein